MVSRDPTSESPVDAAFRPVLTWMANEIAAGRPPQAANVHLRTADTWEVITGILQDYGESLIPLPDRTWESSVCQWYGHHWQVLVDLYTEGEGRSDLVMHVDIIEADGGFDYSLHLVHVP